MSFLLLSHLRTFFNISIFFSKFSPDALSPPYLPPPQHSHTVACVEENSQRFCLGIYVRRQLAVLVAPWKVVLTLFSRWDTVSIRNLKSLTHITYLTRIWTFCSIMLSWFTHVLNRDFSHGIWTWLCLLHSNPLLYFLIPVQLMSEWKKYLWLTESEV